MRRFLFLLAVVFSMLFVFSCGGTPPPVVESPPTEPPPPAPPEPTVTPEPVRDTAKPVLSVNLSPRYFSPDGDGTDDTLTAALSAASQAGLGRWSFEINEPRPPHGLFYKWEGEGNPPAGLTWDGLSDSGELVQSASDYPYVFSATTTTGNSSQTEGLVEVDILVIRDGDILKAKVPSIVFAANSGGFEGLDPETLANNDRILRRIAEVLNKFNTYKVRVEGHANPLTTTERERQTEEQNELGPLSEARAKSVMDYLVNLGVSDTRLSYYGVGGTKPLVPYEDGAGWWKNRRVEFVLIK